MQSQTIIVLFNLRADADAGAYEQWARTTDLPVVRGLKSIERFDVFRATGVLGGGTAPYAYVEVIRVADPERFGKDIATPLMQRVAAEFQSFADRPVFIVGEPL